MKEPCLTSEDLATRWDLKEATIGQWRWFGRGPSFLKIGTLVLYRIEDVEEFEALAAQQMRQGSCDEVFSKIRLKDEQDKKKKGEI